MEQQNKKTLILGASTNPARYAWRAAQMLTEYGHEIVPVGIKKGEVAGQLIRNDREIVADVDTLTLYVGPQNQAGWYDYILQTAPRRSSADVPVRFQGHLDRLAQNSGFAEVGDGRYHRTGTEAERKTESIRSCSLCQLLLWISQ